MLALHSIESFELACFFLRIVYGWKIFWLFVPSFSISLTFCSTTWSNSNFQFHRIKYLKKKTFFRIFLFLWKQYQHHIVGFLTMRMSCCSKINSHMQKNTWFSITLSPRTGFLLESLEISWKDCFFFFSFVNSNIYESSFSLSFSLNELTDEMCGIFYSPSRSNRTDCFARLSLPLSVFRFVLLNLLEFGVKKNFFINFEEASRISFKKNLNYYWWSRGLSSQ